MKITKLVCPSCEGSGLFGLFACYGTPCMWCCGDKRVPVKTALRYADHIWMIAGGGYVAGDHDLEHKQELEKRAEYIYSVAQQSPPWKVAA